MAYCTSNIVSVCVCVCVTIALIDAVVPAQFVPFFIYLEIRTRLSELKLGNSSSSQIEELLMELNTQEKKNKMTLNALREQVKLLQAATGNR